MKTSIQAFTLRFIPGLCLLLSVISCGPSKEEIEKKKKQEEENKKYGVEAFQKHKAECENFISKIEALRSKLTRDSAFVTEAEMNPLLRVEVYSDSINVTVLPYDLVMNPDFADYSDIWEIYLDHDAGTALSAYRSIKQGKVQDIYAFNYLEKADIDKMVTSFNVNMRPYLLVVKCDTTVDVKIEDNEKYSGGESAGFVWLADLRTGNVIGKTKIIAVPGEVTVKSKDSDSKMKIIVKTSSDRDARKQIAEWLKKFSPSKVELN